MINPGDSLREPIAHFLDHIENLIAEFGDDPENALSAIGEFLDGFGPRSSTEKRPTCQRCGEPEHEHDCSRGVIIEEGATLVVQVREPDGALEALKPFADYARLEDSTSGHGAEDDGEVIRSNTRPVYKTITIGDFRRAREVCDRDATLAEVEESEAAVKAWKEAEDEG